MPHGHGAAPGEGGAPGDRGSTPRRRGGARKRTRRQAMVSRRWVTKAPTATEVAAFTTFQPRFFCSGLDVDGLVGGPGVVE